MGLMAEQVNESAFQRLFQLFFCVRHRKVQNVQTVNNFESVFSMARRRRQRIPHADCQEFKGGTTCYTWPKVVYVVGR